MKKRTAVGWLFCCCWLTYLTAYLCRVNFSSAMNAITLEHGFSEERLGIIGAVFYCIYAIGQLANGYIGDRVMPNRYMLLALCGTMLCNAGMSLIESFPLMIVIWGANGIFQSMFWSTIIRVLAQNISAEKRATVSVGISLAMPAAYMVSWGLMGQLLDGVAVRWYFLIPAFICIPLIAVWLIFSGRYDFHKERSNAPKAGIKETVSFLASEKLHWMLAVCIFHGLIKEGVAYWTPLLLAGMGGAVSSYILVLILPFANLVGIIASRFLLKSARNPFSVLVTVFCIIALLSAGLLLKSQGVFIIGLMALISGLAYANNTILMSFIPMQYTSKNMVASIIGMFDFASYVGAAFSTYVLGKVLSSAGFKPLPGIWLGASLLAIVVAVIVITKRRAAGRELNG